MRRLVLFLLSGLPLASCLGGADRLLVELERPGLDAGLYTGLAGIGVTLLEAYETTGENRYRAGAEHAVELLAQRAAWQDGAAGVSWSTITDIVGGSAGIGLFLIDAAQRLELPTALELPLARATDDPRYLDAALAGARYLQSIAETEIAETEGAA